MTKWSRIKLLNLGLAKYIFLPNFIDEKNIYCINKYIDHYFQTWSKYNFNIFLWTGYLTQHVLSMLILFLWLRICLPLTKMPTTFTYPKSFIQWGGCYCVHWTVKYYYELFSEHLNAFKLNCVNWSELIRSSVEKKQLTFLSYKSSHTIRKI